MLQDELGLTEDDLDDLLWTDVENEMLDEDFMLDEAVERELEYLDTQI
jgi:hypothetical protein